MRNLYSTAHDGIKAGPERHAVNEMADAVAKHKRRTIIIAAGGYMMHGRERAFGGR